MCPLAAECREKNFKQWKCWGADLAACKARVMDHLVGSGVHQDASGNEDRTEVYRQAVDEGDYVEHRLAPERRGTKRAHPSRVEGDDGEAIPIGAVVPRRERGAPSADAAGETAVMPLPRRTSSAQVTMSVNELKALADTLHRASRSASALARVCGAAVTACKDEKEVIDEAREAMRARIESAGFVWNPPS